MDKTRRVLTIVLITLSIISLTFGLCKKVGLCSDEPEFSLAFTPSLEYFDDSSGLSPGMVFSLIVNQYNLRHSSDPIDGLGDLFFCYAVNSKDNSNIYYYFYTSMSSSFLSNEIFYLTDNIYRHSPFSLVHVNNSNSASNSFYLGTKSGSPIEVYVVTYNLSSHTYTSSYSTNTNFIRIPYTGDYYPFYIGRDIIYTSSSISTSSGFVSSPDPGAYIFRKESVQPSPVPDGHTKGGNIAEYVPIDDSNADVSTITPSSNDTNQYLQLITNLLQDIKGSTQNGFKNFVDNLKDFFNPVFGKFEKDLEKVIEFLTPPTKEQVVDCWTSGFTNSPISGLRTLNSSISTLFNGFLNISAPQHLAFEYNLPSFNLGTGFGSAYVLGQTMTIDFDWYNNIRSVFIGILAPLLYLSFIWALWVKIPNMIHGVSGTIQDVGSTGRSNISSKGGKK